MSDFSVVFQRIFIYLLPLSLSLLIPSLYSWSLFFFFYQFSLIPVPYSILCRARALLVGESSCPNSVVIGYHNRNLLPQPCFVLLLPLPAAFLLEVVRKRTAGVDFEDPFYNPCLAPFTIIFLHHFPSFPFACV